MTRGEVCARIKEIGIIPAIRVSSADEAHFAATAVAHGGIPIVEITLTVPGAIKLISHLVQHHPKLMVGAGTVMDTETAQQCVEAGAHFLTAPGFDPAISDFARKANVAVLPGALTPTEIAEAWRTSCDLVKVFPCAHVGGDKYIKSIKAALPQVQLVAAGGVNQQNAAAFILAGAEAIGIGTQLIPTESIERRQADRIHELAQRFLGFVKDARSRLAAHKESAVAHK
jgi:2-dehydro-3-deoxyphosphogluconate aldolase / (4S)-4-hydroxy-2-oxoglutarate aldolase